ncbi:MAG TPA: hypothetical protein VFK50_03340 [Sphingomicrobium sp.]|nr:hypothetical protein [Sphingomicrobium sp.]
MDSELQVSLAELPDGEALDREKRAIQTTLAEQGSRIGRLHWALTRDTALRGLRDCLGNLNPVDCIARGWSTANQVQDLARQTADDPNAEKELPLAKHALSVAVHPLVTIHCDPIALPTLRFTLTIDATVECAVLIIRGGKLAAIEAAQIRPSATLSYGDHELKRIMLKPIEIVRPSQFAGGGLTVLT